jgi:hypothetical protein
VQVAADVRGLLVEHRLDAVLPDARLGVAAHLRVGAALRDERGGDRLPVERGAVDERGARGLFERLGEVVSPEAFLEPGRDDAPCLLAEALDAAAVLVADEVPLGAGHVGDDAAVDRVELGADRQTLPAPGVGARGGDHLLRGVVERRLDARRHDRRGAARCGHRLGDQAPSLGGGRARPIDVQDGDRLAHGVDIRTPGGATELRGQESHRAIEPGARAEVHGLGHGEPEEALDELVGSHAGLVDHEEPVSGSGRSAHRRPPRAAARHGSRASARGRRCSGAPSRT